MYCRQNASFLRLKNISRNDYQLNKYQIVDIVIIAIIAPSSSLKELESTAQKIKIYNRYVWPGLAISLMLLLSVYGSLLLSSLPVGYSRTSSLARGPLDTERSPPSSNL
jgi:hypothetical protein